MKLTKRDRHSMIKPLTFALLLSGFAFFGAATEIGAQEAGKRPSAGDIYPQTYDPVIPKTPHPVEEIYVLDFGLEKAKGDGASIVVMPTITAFQGLINRGSSTKVFLDKAPLSLVNYPELSHHKLNVPDGGNIGPGNPFQMMLDDGLVVDNPANIHYVSLNADDAHPVLDWLLANYGHKLKGLVKTPDDIYTTASAGGRAAAYNACTFESDETTGYLLPAHKSIVTYINGKMSPDVPITYDLSAMSNSEAFDWSMHTKGYINHSLRKRNAMFIGGCGIHFTECMVDYFVSTYSYSFFLDSGNADEKTRCDELFTLSNFDAGALIIGESEIQQLLGKGGAGRYFTASNLCVPNCSVTSSIGIDRTDFQPAPTPQTAAIDGNGLYISFNGPDGDALAWDFVVYKAMRKASDPYVDSVPMGVRICPYLVDLFPTMFEWFTKQYPGNNDIVPSPWDGGFPSEPEGQAAGRAMHEHYINTCNGAFRIWNTFHDFAHGNPDTYHSYTSGLDMHSVILGYSGAESGDVLRWDIRDGRVYCNMVGRHNDTYAETVTKIKNALAADAVPGQPAFVMVRSNTEAGYHGWTDAKAVLDMLEADPAITRTIYPLTPRDQAETYKVWKTAGDTSHLLPQSRIPDSLGVNIHFKRECKDLDLIAEAGWKFIRMDLLWIGVEEKKGVYDFQKPGYDELTEACAKRGIRIIYILCYENPLYTSSRAIRTEEQRKAFAAFAAAAVEHYKDKGIIWEIWNEPNIGGFWKPKPNVDEYMALVKATVPEMRKADPNAYTCAPATSGIRFPWLEGCFKQGLLDQVDALSVHPYREQIPETALQDFDKLQAMMGQYRSSGKGIPVISSEWGYSVINWDRRIIGQYNQASRLIRQSIINLYRNVPITIWYDWKDDGHDPAYHEHHFGTVLPDYTPKVAYKAMTVFSRVFDGYTVGERLDLRDDNHFVFRLSNDEKHAYALWTIGDGKSMTVPLKAGNGKLVTMTGEYDLISWGEKGLNIHVSDQPQYLFLSE